MMSAPSVAIRTACARPCPLAVPVMKATLSVSSAGHAWAALTRLEPMISRWISLVPS